MKYYYLIIITKGKVNLDENLDVLLINESCELVDDKHIKYNNDIYEFEYLIYSNLVDIKNTFVVCENEIPITNYYHQTSLDHIYYINEDNLQETINDIINNE
jgi:hypothetical protein